MSTEPTQVLVVDDDASFGGMVADTLRDDGYLVVAATSPHEGLEKLAEATYAAAVLDLHMPGMDGMELADRIKAHSPETQVLILTGQGDMDSAIEGIHRGVFDYLQKGTVSVTRLQLAVRNAVERFRLTHRNRDLVARLQESNRLLKALHDVGTGLTGEPHLDRLADRLAASARDLCGAAAGRAMIFGRTHDEGFVVELSAGEGGETIRGARLKPGEGIATLVAERDEAILLERAAEHPRFSSRCDEIPATLPGFLCAPLRRGSVFGALVVAGRPGGFGTDDRDLLSSLARQASIAIENALNHERSINFFTHTSEILISFLESLDVFYPGHSRGVAALADMVTRRLGLSDADRRNVHYAALLHDIGKVMVDPAVLKSEGPISEQNRRLMREHPALGVQLLKPVILWEEMLPIIHSHHERWDGRGYPLGLPGETIPLGARVVAVADAFDAMTRSTPHGARRTPEEALAELEACGGAQFDPRIVRLFSVEYREHGEALRA